ncbi:MAG: tRNA uridine-5-carboxymethylaminomethyl(34) synthesis GTPase MnmE [Candidatus Omnitrophica bacterium]|nr:tRNA uridine-5-carboxymethylaminomethyl(34) synthesis GTPase MnmE [Candidatus Omnitrophota bacterium]
MYQYKGLEDTIVAIATPSGNGAIGVIRLSGPSAIAVSDAVLRLQGPRTLSQSDSHVLRHGWVINAHDGGVIDEVLVSLMKGPRSYTGEDTVEFNCHGGMTVLSQVLQVLLKAGARQAMPGEFTKRAFLNGRMDLAQAEAVIDVINARTEKFLATSQNQLKGALSSELHLIREELMKTYTTLEALINFPEDGLESQNDTEIMERLHRETTSIKILLESSKSGRLLKEGIRLVLCGRANVGKSSLLNALLQQQRAIVTDIPGTTRDVLEESAQIQGVPVLLVDTAGILVPRDMIEEEAIKRSHLYIKSADIVLLVLDHSTPLGEDDMRLMNQLKDSRVLVVINKMDLEARMDEGIPQALFGKEHMVKVCALSPQSVKALESKVLDTIHEGLLMDTHSVLVSNIRHIKALEEAQNNLEEASRFLKNKMSIEFVAEEIKLAVNQLDAITGRHIDVDLLDRIFADFCIGK